MANKVVKTYDPSKVDAICGVLPLTGFAAGSFITVEFDEDAFTKYVGSQGEGARAKSCNVAAKVTIRLMQTSDSNDVLTDFALADKFANGGIFPFAIKDNSPNGRTFCIADSMWVKKQPSIDYSNEIGVREWVLDTTNLTVYLGGN